MKKTLCFFSFLLFIVFFSTQITAQVTNLKVNGSSSPFTITSGGNLLWTYNLSVGGTSLVEVWVDVNANGTIEPGTDTRMFLFTITDGNANGLDGPGDMDGATNGAISVGPMPLGLAPTSYILKATENNVGQTITGTVSHITSPAFTIKGKVTPPSGSSAANIIVEMNRSDQIPGVLFWNAITDVNGDFTVETNTDTTGPWTLELSIDQNLFPSAIIVPNNYNFFIPTNLTGKNFVVTNSDAKVVGILKKEDGTPLPFETVSLTSTNGQFQIQRFANTNGNGLFQIGLLSSELNGQPWNLQGWLRSADTTETYMDADVKLNPINVSDSIYKDITLYVADATITGTITFQAPPAAFGGNNTNVAKITIDALTDSTQSLVHNNTTTGNYTVRVSSKIPSYTISEFNLPSGYDPITLFNIAPGATNVNLNFVLTGVKERTSGIPESYILSQNYPNPFNPTTNINYDIPSSSFVNITVYNELGQKVITLVNKNQKAGKYVVSFNAKGLSSGVYFLKIKANDFAQTKKMILLK